MSAPAISISSNPWLERCRSFPIGLPEACLWLAAQQVLPSLIVEQLALESPKPPAINSLQVIIRLGITLVFLAYFLLARRGTLEQLGLTSKRPLGDFLWGLAACLVMGVLYLIAAGAAYLFATWYFGSPDKLMVWVRGALLANHSTMYVLGVCLAYPIFEEIWFRGLMYPPMRAALGRGLTILLLSIIFAAAHDAAVPVTQFIGGLAFAYAYERRQTLIAPIMLHIAGNGSLIVAGYAYQQGWLPWL